MTKRELISFLEPFTDDIKLVNVWGEPIEVKYRMYDEKGVIVVNWIDNKADEGSK